MTTNHPSARQDELVVGTICKTSGEVLTIGLALDRKNVVVRRCVQVRGRPVPTALTVEINIGDLQGIVSGFTAALVEAQKHGLLPV